MPVPGGLCDCGKPNAMRAYGRGGGRGGDYHSQCGACLLNCRCTPTTPLRELCPATNDCFEYCRQRRRTIIAVIAADYTLQRLLRQALRAHEREPDCEGTCEHDAPVDAHWDANYHQSNRVFVEMWNYLGSEADLDEMVTPPRRSPRLHQPHHRVVENDE